jgi:hypothetical protein
MVINSETRSIVFFGEIRPKGFTKVFLKACAVSNGL